MNLFKKKERPLEELAEDLKIELISDPGDNYEHFKVMGSGKSRAKAERRLLENAIKDGANYMVYPIKTEQPGTNDELEIVSAKCYKSMESRVA